MATKRFVSIGKFKDKAYRDLSPRMKLALDYLKCECSNAGIWPIELDVMSIRIGFPESYTLDEVLEGLKGRVYLLGSDHLFIFDHFQEQYGKSKEGFAAKVSALEELREFGLVNENGSIRIPSQEPQGSVIGVSSESHSNSRGNSNLEGGVGETNSSPPKPKDPTFDFESLYREYPLKKGKSKGLHACKAQIKTPAEFEQLRKAIIKYRTDCKGKDAQYIKHFKTFMSEWRDWLDDDAGSASLTTIQGSGPPDPLDAEADLIFEAGQLFKMHDEDGAYTWLSEKLGPIGPAAVECYGGWGHFKASGTSDKRPHVKYALKKAREQAEVS